MLPICATWRKIGGGEEGVSVKPLGCVGSYALLLGYKEEGMLAASFSVGWTVPIQGKVLSVSDCCPAAVSFAAVAAVVAVVGCCCCL